MRIKVAFIISFISLSLTAEIPKDMAALREAVQKSEATLYPNVKEASVSSRKKRQLIEIHKNGNGMVFIIHQNFPRPYYNTYSQEENEIPEYTTEDESSGEFLKPELSTKSYPQFTSETNRFFSSSTSSIPEYKPSYNYYSRSSKINKLLKNNRLRPPLQNEGSSQENLTPVFDTGDRPNRQFGSFDRPRNPLSINYYGDGGLAHYGGFEYNAGTNVPSTLPRPLSPLLFSTTVSTASQEHSSYEEFDEPY